MAHKVKAAGNGPFAGSHAVGLSNGEYAHFQASEDGKEYVAILRTKELAEELATSPAFEYVGEVDLNAERPEPGAEVTDADRDQAGREADILRVDPTADAAQREATLVQSKVIDPPVDEETGAALSATDYAEEHGTGARAYGHRAQGGQPGHQTPPDPKEVAQRRAQKERAAVRPHHESRQAEAEELKPTEDGTSAPAEESKPEAKPEQRHERAEQRHERERAAVDKAEQKPAGDRSPRR